MYLSENFLSFKFSEIYYMFIHGQNNKNKETRMIYVMIISYLPRISHNFVILNSLIKPFCIKLHKNFMNILLLMYNPFK